MCANVLHNSDVTMSAIASQITSLTIVCSTVYSGADQRKYQSPVLLAFVEFTLSVNSPHKGPVTWKILPCDDVIILFGAMTFITSMITISSAGDYWYIDENRLMNTILLKGLQLSSWVQPMFGNKAERKIHVSYQVFVLYLGCWSLNISMELDQYHGTWWPVS